MKSTGKNRSAGKWSKSSGQVGNGHKSFRLRVRNEGSRRGFMVTLPFRPYDGLYLYVSWVGDYRKIDHVQWNPSKNCFDCFFIPPGSALAHPKTYACVLRSDDCRDGCKVDLPHVPQEGMFFQVPWRDGKFFKATAACWIKKGSYFDVFIEYVVPRKAEPLTRMKFHEILFDIFEDDCVGIENYAAELEVLCKVVGINPNLQEEVDLLNRLHKILERLWTLRDEANADFEKDMDTETPISTAQSAA